MGFFDVFDNKEDFKERIEDINKEGLITRTQFMKLSHTFKNMTGDNRFTFSEKNLLGEQIDAYLELKEKFLEVSSDKFLEFTDGEYFEEICVNGKFSEEEREKRTEVLDYGIEIFRDVGMTFYKIQRGDSIGGIKKKLIEIPEFSYLSQKIYNRSRAYGFNMKNSELIAGNWIPIPIEYNERIMDDREFAWYVNEGIDRMLLDEYYGKFTKQLVDKVGRASLIKIAMATAKHESCGNPIGSMALHRWEHHKREHSYSHYHVLMRGAGLRARKKLNFSNGQTTHPINGTELFIAFLIEKNATRNRKREITGINKLIRLFPIKDNLTSYTVMYNGRDWKRKNPQYPGSIKKYLTQSEKVFPKDKTAIESLSAFLSGSASYIEDIFTFEDDNTKKSDKEKNERIGELMSDEILTPSSNKKYIKNFQKSLKALGFYTGKVDSDYGPATEGAVKTLQKSLARYLGISLNETGKYDMNTVKAVFEFQCKVYEKMHPGFLYAGNLSPNTIKKMRSEFRNIQINNKPVVEVAQSKYGIDIESELVNPNSDVKKIKQLQNSLGQLGLLKARGRGVYGNLTRKAVKKLQKGLGVEQTGMYDTSTIEAVYLFQTKVFNNMKATKSYAGNLSPSTISKLYKKIFKGKRF